MYQKLSIVSLLALSAAANASPSRFAKRVAQDLDPLVGGESDIYKTIQRAEDPNVSEIPLLGPGIYTTINGVVQETPEVPVAPVAPGVQVDPEVADSPVVPETPEAYTTVDEQVEDPSVMPEVPEVAPVDSTFTDIDVYDPEVTVTPTTSSFDLEPTMAEDDGEDTMVDAGAGPTESLTGSMMDPYSFNGTMSESSTSDGEQTTSLAPSDLTTATIYSTKTFTITDCGPTVVCTGGADETLTSVVAVSTTICPVSEATKFATVAPNPPRVTVVDEDTTDNIVEDVYDQEVVVDVDGDELTTTIPITSTRTVTEVRPDWSLKMMGLIANFVTLQFITADDAKATDEVVVVDEVEDVDDVADEFVPSGDDVVDDVKEGSGGSAGDFDGDDVGDSFDDEDEVTLTVSSTTTIFDVVTVTPTGSVEGSPDTVGVDSGKVDSQGSSSDGFSDGSGSAGGVPECVPIVETVTERETVTAEPVTIVETVTVVSTRSYFDFSHGKFINIKL